MNSELLSSPAAWIEPSVLVKRMLPIVLLALFWFWETWRPFFGQHEGRWRHAARNLATAIFNTVILGLAFGVLTVTVTEWATRNQYGLLHAFHFAQPVRLALALILLDGWMYVWHRANHSIPQLWRFHRMHHSDRYLDVTSATRFHLGEHIGSSVLRLALVPILGFQMWDFLIYELLVVAITQFHHADISIGWLDQWLRWLIVTPYMHKVHHSDWQPETDSNYSTVLSVWDRLAGTFRMRSDPKTIVFGLAELNADSWQSCWGMLKTPFVNPSSQVGLAFPAEAESGAQRAQSEPSSSVAELVKVQR